MALDRLGNDGLILPAVLDKTQLDKDLSEVGKRLANLYEQAARAGKAPKLDYKSSLSELEKLLLREERLSRLRDASHNPARVRAFTAEIAKTRAEVEKIQATTSKTDIAGQLQNKFGQFKGFLKGEFAAIGTAAAGIFAGVAIGDFLTDSIAEFQRAEKVASQLKAQIVDIGNEGEAAFNKLTDQATKLQDVGIFDDDDIKQAQVMLSQFGLSAREIEKLTPIITDFAAATGQSVEAATQDVISGVNGQERALKRYGIEVESGASKAQNLGSIMQQMGQKFAGANQRIAETTTSGALAKFSNQVGELKESLGGILATVLLPLVQGLGFLTKGLEALLNGFEDTAPSINAFNEPLAAAAQIYPTLNDETNEATINTRALGQQYGVTVVSLKDLNDETERRITLLKNQNTAEVFREGTNVANERAALQKKLNDYLATTYGYVQSIDTAAAGGNKELGTVATNFNEILDAQGNFISSFQIDQDPLVQNLKLQIAAKSDLLKQIQGIGFDKLNAEAEQSLGRIGRLKAEISALQTGLDNATDSDIEPTKAKIAAKQKELDRLLAIVSAQAGSVSALQARLNELKQALDNTNPSTAKAALLAEQYRQTNVELADAIQKVNDLLDDADPNSIDKLERELSEMDARLKKANLTTVESIALGQQRDVVLRQLTDAQEAYNVAVGKQPDVTNTTAAVNVDLGSIDKSALDLLNLVLTDINQKLLKNQLTEREYIKATEQAHLMSEVGKLNAKKTYLTKALEAERAANGEMSAGYKELERQLNDVLNKLSEKQIKLVRDINNELIKMFTGLDVSGIDFTKLTDASKDAAEEAKAPWEDWVDAIANSAIQASNQVLDAFIQTNEQQQEVQQRRVEKAERIAERGNAELLQKEEERMEKLEEKQRAFVQTQQALNLVLAASNIIVAIAKAASQTGVGAPIAIAAVIAAIGAGVAAAANLANAAGGFKEGGFTGEGHPDEVAGVAHKGEYYFPAPLTKKYRTVFEEIHKGKIDLNDVVGKAKLYEQMRSPKVVHEQLVQGVTVQAERQSSFAQVEQKLDRVVDAIEAIPVPNFKLDEGGLHRSLKTFEKRKQNDNALRQ